MDSQWNAYCKIPHYFKLGSILITDFRSILRLYVCYLEEKSHATDMLERIRI